MLPTDARTLVRRLQALNVRLAPVAADGAPLHARPRRLLSRLERAGVGLVETRPTAAGLRSLGFAPKTVIDVGVHAGTPALYRAFPEARFVLVDAMAECEARVAPWRDRIAFDFHACALGAEDGEMALNIPASGARVAAARASLHDYAPGYRETFGEIETRTVPVRTLDGIAADVAGPVGIKIDTEGFELQVIQGARKTLARTEFVIAEVSLRPRFAGGYRFSELIGALGAEGFEALATLTPLRPGAAATDMVFARWDSPHFALG